MYMYTYVDALDEAYRSIYGADCMLQIVVSSFAALSCLPHRAASDAMVHASSHIRYSCVNNSYVGSGLATD